VLSRLNCQEGVTGVLLDLPLNLGLSRVTHYKQSGGSERSREQHQPQQQFGAQSQVFVASKEGFQDLAYPWEMERLPPIMRGRKKAFQNSLARRRVN